MNISEIKELINLIEESNLTELEVEQDGVRVAMKKGTCMPMPQMAPVQVQAPAQAPEKVVVSEITKEEKAVTGKTINSPMVGTFYASSAPDKPAYVKVGDMVKKGQVVCIVEAMKLMNEIESDVDGEIVEILVNNEEMVEFGQPMFVIK